MERKLPGSLRKDYTGQMVGRNKDMLVLGVAGIVIKDKRTVWMFQCPCGNLRLSININYEHACEIYSSKRRRHDNSIRGNWGSLNWQK